MVELLNQPSSGLKKKLMVSEFTNSMACMKTPKAHLLIMFLGDDHGGVPNGFISIADDGVGNLIIICLEGPHRGSIHFLDHEIHPYHQRNSSEGITKLAGSFSSFASLLIADPG